MQKPTPAALSAFDAAFPDDSRASRKKMFGMPAGFINGNMFLGVFADGVVLRLSPERLVALSELDGVGAFEPMPGRPWKEYVTASATTCEHEALAGWAMEALDHTALMAPKVAKAKKTKKS